MRLVWALMLVGCGRLGFETSRDGTLSGDDDGGGSGSDAMVDGPPNNPDAMDTVTTFGENPAADVNGVTIDTFISQAGGATFNFGGADNIRIERDNGERGLIAFDIDLIPATATVLTASIRFFLEDAAPSTISFHSVNELWDEGSQDGSNGAANYTMRTSVLPWSLVGAGEPASIGMIRGSFSGGGLGMIDVALPASLVQSWVDSPNANFGILLESTSDTTVRLVSSEGTTSMRPVLTVTYE